MYSQISSLNGVVFSKLINANGLMAQTLFSFNLIEEIERKIGKIPGSTVADKVTWLKSNIVRLTGTWYGFGSSVGGNKASFANWRVDVNSWNSQTSHTKSTVTSLSQSIDPTLVPLRIDTDGFVHFLAYAEASDGITASIINTDYVELEIELKPNANFSAPRIPLYEVPQESYDKILVEWDAAAVANRYQMVEGVKSLQNPIVTVEGDNLFPPLTEWSLHANAKINAPYELELNATAANQGTAYKMSCLPNTPFAMSGKIPINGRLLVYEHDINGNYLNLSKLVNASTPNVAFTTSANTRELRFTLDNGTAVGDKLTFSELNLNLGSVKPFKPRNPSYLYAETLLRGINGVNDLLYQEDGRWKTLKRCEMLLLDGSLNWDPLNMDFSGFKRFRLGGISNYAYNSQILLKYNGSLVPIGTVEATVNRNTLNSTGFYVTIADAETGFAESYTPTSDEVKAHFNGWKVKTVDGSNKPTAWMSVIDGKDAPTQTLAYVVANKAPDYIGYHLFYQLSTPKIDDITNKVEGSLSVSGQTQVSLDSGVIVREKTKPSIVASLAYINRKAGDSNDNPLSNRVLKILNIYKGTNSDLGNWSMESGANGLAYGAQRAVIPTNLYDSAADYSVTYLVQEKERFTTNPVNVKASYNTSIRSTVDQMNEQLADVRSLASVHDRYLYKLLLAAKANGWSV
ncbi:hypothetical protein ACLHDF_29980 [Priestia aryabhattai]|uniref:hypothetical protein n=1 Tax=Priestia megaterium TaxID=1404 RepID=UPI0039B8B417